MAQLGHDSPAIRIGAIQSLEQLSQMDRAFYPRVIETLCAFIREHRTIKPEPDGETESERVSVDIQLALTVLGRRDRRWEQHGNIIDLHECRLCGANLSEGTWTRAIFYKADLGGANLRGANLWRANLVGADLELAVLCEANLLKTDLAETCLLGADLAEANLWGTNFREAIGLAQEQIETACQHPNADPPILPDGLTWHGRICERYQTDEE